MKNKKTLRFLTFGFVSFLIMFVIMTHLLVGQGNFATSLGKAVNEAFAYFTRFHITPAFILYSLVLLISLIVAIVWVVKLIRRKSIFSDYMQPVFFLVAIIIGVGLIAYRKSLEARYEVQALRLTVVYFIITALLTIAYGIHLMIFGLVSLSKKPAIENKAVTDLLEDLGVDNDKNQTFVVEEKVEEPVVEEEKVAEPAPAPVVIERVIEKEVIVPAPVVVPVVEETPVVEELDENGNPIVRLPFAKRLIALDKEMRDKYSDIKNYILSYGVKSRVSNSADSYRAHRKLYVKITTSGKSGLKVYYALNLKDYADSKLPLKDASDVKAYEEVPTFIYVKSDLSVKRAKALIDDVMTKDGFVRDENFKEADQVRAIRKTLRENNQL